MIHESKVPKDHRMFKKNSAICQSDTLPETIMEVDSGPLEDYVHLPREGCPLPWLLQAGYISILFGPKVSKGYIPVDPTRSLTRHCQTGVWTECSSCWRWSKVASGGSRYCLGAMRVPSHAAMAGHRSARPFCSTYKSPKRLTEPGEHCADPSFGDAQRRLLLTPIRLK